MNKVRLISVIIFLIPLTLKGQKTNYDQVRRFRLGLLSGINVSAFQTRIGEFGAGQSNYYDNYVRISPYLGFHARYSLSSAISIRGELLYNTRGGSYRNENTGVSTISSDPNAKNYYYKNYRLDYFEIPLLASIDLSSKIAIEKVHVQLAGGLSYGLLLSSTLRYNEFIPNGTVGILTKVEDTYKVDQFDYANKSVLNALAEISFDFLNRHYTPLFFRLRYSKSLDDVYQSSPTDQYNLKTKMMTGSFTFGLYF